MCDGINEQATSLWFSYPQLILILRQITAVLGPPVKSDKQIHIRRRKLWLQCKVSATAKNDSSKIAWCISSILI